MDELPQITPLAPTVVPAQEEKTYSAMWMTTCAISAESPGKPAQAAFELVPYDPATGETSPRPEDRVRFVVADLFAEAKKYPATVGQAMGAFLMGVAGLYPVKHLEAMVADLENMVEQLEDELANAQKQLAAGEKLPDANIAKKYNIAQAQERIGIAQAAIDEKNNALAELKPQLATVTARLQPAAPTPAAPPAA